MNSQRPYDLLERTRQFASETIQFCAALPQSTEVGVIRRQLVRSAASVGANYRAARRARSHRDFIAKLSIVEEEADECVYWFDLLRDLGAGEREKLGELAEEASQLAAIMVHLEENRSSPIKVNSHLKSRFEVEPRWPDRVVREGPLPRRLCI